MSQTTPAPVLPMPDLEGWQEMTRPDGSVIRVDYKAMMLPATWAAFHGVEDPRDRIAIERALTFDLSHDVHPAVSGAVAHLFAHPDTAAVNEALRELSSLPDPSGADVVRIVDRHAPGRENAAVSLAGRNAFPATRVISSLRSLRDRTVVETNSLIWLLLIDPHLFFATYAAGRKAYPVFGLAAAAHWLAEEKAGTRIDEPQVGKVVDVAANFIGRPAA